MTATALKTVDHLEYAINPDVWIRRLPKQIETGSWPDLYTLCAIALRDPKP